MRQLVIALSIVAAAGVPTATAPAPTVAQDELLEGISCSADPSQTYTLYLPPGYTPERLWPVLLVFDPRGRSVAAAEIFHEAAKDYGWIIVSSNDTRSDGPWEPNIRAVNALWPEVHGRIAGDPRRIYAAGFSGGATVAHTLAQQSGEIAGVVACGGPLVADLLEGSVTPVFGTAGNLDFNFRALNGMDAQLAGQDVQHRRVIFEGAHEWMPPSVARQALEWFEVLAMQRGLEVTDPELVGRLFSKDVALAEELASEGKELEAAQRFRAIERTFDGLHDVTGVRTRAAMLEASREARRQQKDEKRWEAFEKRSAERLAVQAALLKAADLPPTSQQMARELHIEELLRRAESGGAEGEAVQRVLNSYSIQLGFYLTREFLSSKQWDRAAVSLELALEIRDDNRVGWYNLACCRARIHRPGAAVEALARAVELGFDDAELLMSDADLDSLRDRADFNALLAEVTDG